MKTLSIYDPFVEFDRVFEGLFPNKSRDVPTEGNLVPMDVFAKEGAWILRASLPGIKPEDIDLTVENGMLTIRGKLSFEDEHQEAKVYRREIASGAFVRSIRLPGNVDVEKAEATFAHGFVTVTVPKLVEDKPGAFRVPLKALDSPNN